MKVKPVLGDWEIPRIESIQTLERRAYVEHEVPGRAASLYQDLNTVPTRVAIVGSLYGDEARDEFLDKVRTKFHDGAPLTFVADIVTATSIQHVVIDTLEFQESGGKPDQLDYFIVLRESPPPPPPPNPLGAIDTGLLDQAESFVGSATNALSVVEQLADLPLGDLPELVDPTPPLRGALDAFLTAGERLGDVLKPVKDVVLEPPEEGGENGDG